MLLKIFSVHFSRGNLNKSADSLITNPMNSRQNYAGQTGCATRLLSDSRIKTLRFPNQIADIQTLIGGTQTGISTIK